MKHATLAFALILSLITFVACAEDPPKPEASKDAAAPAGAEQTKSGTLGEKPLTAAEGIVAVLHVRTGAAAPAGDGGKKAAKKAAKADGGKKAKKAMDAAAPGTEQTFYLAASGEVATKLADLARRSAQVTVTGVVAGDTIKVSSITESAAPAKADAGAGEKKKRKKDKKNNA
jgi:hypothetical protein